MGRLARTLAITIGTPVQLSILLKQPGSGKSRQLRKQMQNKVWCASRRTDRVWMDRQARRGWVLRAGGLRRDVSQQITIQERGGHQLTAAGSALPFGRNSDKVCRAQHANVAPIRSVSPAAPVATALHVARQNRSCRSDEREGKREIQVILQVTSCKTTPKAFSMPSIQRFASRRCDG